MSEDITPNTEETPTQGTTEGNTNGFSPITTQEEFDRVAKGIRFKVSKDFETYKASHEELEKIKEANKTESQKMTDEIAKLKADVASYQAKEQISGWIVEVAKDKGIDANQLALLGGTSKEQIEAQADVLAKATKKDSTPVVPGDGSQPSSSDSGDWLRNQMAAK